MIALIFACAAIGAPNVDIVLKGLDPVELIAGREVRGKDNISETFLRHKYLFASEANRRRFHSNPIRFAVHAGGACGKMGELTGRGSPDRYAVASGRIFLFASDGCREAFLANKDRYFARRGSAPKTSVQQKLEASRVFKAIQRAHGGKAIQRLRNVVWRFETPYNDSGKMKIWNSLHAYAGPERFAQWEEWDAGKVFFVVDGSQGYDGKPGEVYGLHPSERRALTALFARHPVGILMGAASPHAPLPRGEGVTMTRGDIVFDVLTHPKTSRIASVRFKDVYNGPVQRVEIEFNDYAEIFGVWLPRSFRTKVESGEWSKPRTAAAVIANVPDPVVFAEARTSR